MFVVFGVDFLGIFGCGIGNIENFDGVVVVLGRVAFLVFLIRDFFSDLCYCRAYFFFVYCLDVEVEF